MSKDPVLENMDASEAEAIKFHAATHKEAKLIRAIRQADGMSLIVGKGDSILAWYKGEKYLTWTDLEKALVG